MKFLILICNYLELRVLKKERGKEEEYRYYIESIEPDVELFERASRGHWGIEVNLHWHLDFTFRDDKNRSMEKTGESYAWIQEGGGVTTVKNIGKEQGTGRYANHVEEASGKEETIHIYEYDVGVKTPAFLENLIFYSK